MVNFHLQNGNGLKEDTSSAAGACWFLMKNTFPFTLFAACEYSSPCPLTVCRPLWCAASGRWYGEPGPRWWHPHWCLQEMETYWTLQTSMIDPHQCHQCAAASQQWPETESSNQDLVKMIISSNHNNINILLHGWADDQQHVTAALALNAANRGPRWVTRTCQHVPRTVWPIMWLVQ